MTRTKLALVAMVGFATAIGGGCKKDEGNDDTDLAAAHDMSVTANDLSATPQDMAMRTPANGQVIIAEIQGSAYGPTGADGGIAPTFVHALAAIAQFPEFEPMLDPNDESNLAFLPTPSGCSIQTFDPVNADLPESSANAGLVTAAPVNGGILGVAPGIDAPTPLPGNGAAVGCGFSTAPGFGVYGCAWNALDADMGQPWNGKLATLSAFPVLQDAMFAGNCPSANYDHPTGLCIPKLLTNTLNVQVSGMTGPFATGTTGTKIPVTVPGEVTVTGIKVGATSLTLPSTFGTVALDGLNGAFTTNEALEISFTCTGTGAGSCAGSAGTEASLVGLLATTSAVPRGGQASATAKFAVAQCVAATDSGKVTMSASQVTKLRAAAAGGSIQFVLARINAQVDSENTPRLIIRGAGRGQFAYINQ